MASGDRPDQDPLFDNLSRVPPPAPDEGAPEALRARLEADRRAVLADVGLDPRKSNTALRHELRQLVEALIGEALDDPEIVPDAGLFLHRAMLFDAAQQRANAIRALEDGLRVHPNHPELVRQLQFRQEGG